MSTSTLPVPTLPATEDRVPQHTSDEINQRIARQTEERLATLAGASKDTISRRLLELDREWDIERTLETNASSLIVASATLAVFEDRRWGLLTIAVGAFLLQHAVQGWCPPLPILRRLGFRTAGEINEERVALRLLRGDFAYVPQTGKDALTLAQEN